MNGYQHRMIEQVFQFDFLAFTCAANVILVQVTNGGGSFQGRQAERIVYAMNGNAEAAGVGWAGCHRLAGLSRLLDCC